MRATRFCSSGCGQPALAWHLCWCRHWWRPGSLWRPLTTGASSRPPRPRRPTASTLWPPTRSALLDALGWERPVHVAGHSWAAGSSRPSCWTILTASVPRRWAAPTSRRHGRSPSPPSTGTWPARLDLPPLFYATETLRYLPTADIQDSEVVGTWLSLIGDVPVWPNPGRLGQYEAALAWSTDPARTMRWPEVLVPCLVLAFEHDMDSPAARRTGGRRTDPGGNYGEIAGRARWHRDPRRPRRRRP